MKSNGSLAGLALLLSAGCGRDAVTERAKPAVVSDAPQPPLPVDSLLANPALLDGRLQVKNPLFAGGVQIAMDPGLGLIGQVSAPAIRDLSALQGLPFGVLDLRGTRVESLEPLRGMPLRLLGLEGTLVSDLAPLRGMRLEKLYLNGTAVGDLGALAGMPLKELQLVGTKVADLGPLRGAPLEMLWLNETFVSNIEALAGCPLISLTLEKTRVEELAPLAAHRTLQRLHIGDTPVRDLSPLRGLKLTRLIFAPGRITNGMDVARNMASLREIGLALDAMMPPIDFWAQYDRRAAE